MEKAGFPNGFSTRVGGVSPPPWDSLNLGASCGDQPERAAENFRRFCGAVGTDADALVKNHQVHGDLVRPVTRADVLPSPGAPGTVEADGLITRTPGLCPVSYTHLDVYKRQGGQVEHGVGGAAQGHIHRLGIVESCLGHNVPGPDILFHQVHDLHPGCLLYTSRYFILMNGAKVDDRRMDKTLGRAEIPWETVEAVIDFLEPLHLSCLLYTSRCV